MWLLLNIQDVVDLHDDALNPSELPGLAADKSIEGALGRIDARIQYGAITDEFDLAAMYAVAISQAHAFNDGNKRTAFSAMDMCLVINGHVISWDMKETGDMIIDVAQGKVNEQTLAAWLRQRVA